MGRPVSNLPKNAGERLKLWKAKQVAIARREVAKARGEKFYLGMPCPKNHKPATRYVSTNICVECQRIKDGGSLRKRKREERKIVVFEPYTEEQQRRLDTGALKFYGAQCKRGHDGLRYARTGACVHCKEEENKKIRQSGSSSKKPRRSWKRERELQREKEMWAIVERAKRKRAAEEQATRCEFDDLLL